MKKILAADLLEIRNSPDREATQLVLNQLENEWAQKYRYAIKSWKDIREKLTTLLTFTLEIRKVIFTTNIIEILRGKIRKHTKNKLSYTSDEGVMKLVFTAAEEFTN